MSSLRDKVVVITGASSGIGAASAIKFAKHGCRLVLSGRNEQCLNEIVDKCVAEGIPRDNVLTVCGNLSEDETVNEIIMKTIDKFGTVNVLFNNAGFASTVDGPLSLNGKVQALDEQYRICVRVPYMLIQGFVGEIIKNKGVIINCSSGHSVLPNPTYTAYCAMKAAMDHFTKVLAIELGMKGVRVNTINPGFVKTGIARILGDNADALWEYGAAVTPLEQKMSTADEIADVVIFLASDQASSISGCNLFCDRATTLTSSVVDFKQFK